MLVWKLTIIRETGRPLIHTFRTRDAIADFLESNRCRVPMAIALDTTRDTANGGEYYSDRTREHYSWTRAEELTVAELVDAATKARTLTVRMGTRILDYVTGRLDPATHADLRAHIAEAPRRRHGNGYRATITTSPDAALQLAAALYDLTDAMADHGLRPGFSNTGGWIDNLADSIKATAEDAIAAALADAEAAVEAADLAAE